MHLTQQDGVVAKFDINTLQPISFLPLSEAVESIAVDGTESFWRHMPLVRCGVQRKWLRSIGRCGDWSDQ